ncbi:late embryogenesis abundant protein 18-like [Telopea speciosissima]|uniref:late embryogenesis abundant protein 18-like n=1 Tax=Telopea speciosissima TaxID=54955 RepID=UPI001CC3728F|nr:late embryogenesis abundant protein 18-like [Telopea speciosissima]
MQSSKEKLSNMASAAKEQINIGHAKAEEKIEKASARTPEEREMAQDRRKAKEVQGNLEFHEEKVQHKAVRLDAKQHYNPYGGHPQHHQHGEYEYPIPMPGGEYPMACAPTARAAPTTVASTGPTCPISGYEGLDAQQQSHLHVHHGKYECPIPTPGGEYPMGGRHY